MKISKMREFKLHKVISPSPIKMHFEPRVLNRYRINVQNKTKTNLSGENITDVKGICNVRLFIEYKNDSKQVVVTFAGILSK